MAPTDGSPIAAAAVAAKADADATEQTRLTKLREQRIADVKVLLRDFFGSRLNTQALSYTYVGAPAAGSVVVDDGTNGLAVDPGNRVWLLRRDGQDWTSTGVQVKSLVDLAAAMGD